MRPMDKIIQYFEIDKNLAKMLHPEYVSYLCSRKDRDQCVEQLKAFLEKEVKRALGDAIILQKTYVYPLGKIYKAEFLLKPKDNAIILEYHLTISMDKPSTLERVIRKDD